MKRYRYSEIFRSVQGEGRYAGVPSLFLRFWGCNFQCRGFRDPTRQIPAIAAHKARSLAEVPVAEAGCDTEYAWAPVFRHLSKLDTATAMADRLMALAPAFHDPGTETWTHLVLTGGEPMLSQVAIVDVLEVLEQRDNLPRFVTIETNATQAPRDTFARFLESRYGSEHREWLWSASPKLRLSGEGWDQAIRPEVLAACNALSPAGQLKYVVDGSDEAWDDVARATSTFRAAGIEWEVMIMPVGATLDRLNETQAAICEGAIERGYRFTPRLHVWLFDNAPGT